MKEQKKQKNKSVPAFEVNTRKPNPCLRPLYKTNPKSNTLLLQSERRPLTYHLSVTWRGRGKSANISFSRFSSRRFPKLWTPPCCLLLLSECEDSIRETFIHYYYSHVWMMSIVLYIGLVIYSFEDYVSWIIRKLKLIWLKGLFYDGAKS